MSFILLNPFRICEYFIAVLAIRLQASSVAIFNGNFSEWHEQVSFHLGVIDLNLALLEDKPVVITDSNREEGRLQFRA